MSGRVVIGGSVAEGFEPVRAAFELNFGDRDELGVSFALYRGPEPLVDLWGGYRDVAGMRATMAARHHGPGPLHQQGARRSCGGARAPARVARLRGAGRHLLARVRAARQGHRHRIGLPADIPESRVAEIDGFTSLQMVLHLNVMPAGMVFAYMWRHDPEGQYVSVNGMWKPSPSFRFGSSERLRAIGGYRDGGNPPGVKAGDQQYESVYINPCYEPFVILASRPG